MKYSTLLIFVTLVSSVISSGSLRDTTDTTVVSDGDGTFRAYSATFTPDALHPKDCTLAGYRLHTNGANFTEEDAVVFTLNTTGVAEFTLGFFRATEHGTGLGGNISLADDIKAFEMILRSLYVFEFDDLNGVPGFQNGTDDQITGHYNLSDPLLTWNDLVIETDDFTTSQGVNVRAFRITAQTTDNVFLFRFTVVGAEAEVGGVRIDANSAKVDVEIRWFDSANVLSSWSTGPSDASLHPNASVGLLSVFAAAAVDFHQAENNAVLNSSNPTLNFGSSNATGFFSYETKAGIVVQGEYTNKSVYADYSDSTKEINDSFSLELLIRVFWFSFEGSRPSLVAWDPEFGAAPEGGSTPSPAGSNNGGSTTGHSSSSIIVPAFMCIAAILFLFF